MGVKSLCNIDAYFFYFQVYSGDDGFIGGEITVGRLLELVLLLLLILISSAGFIASIFAHRTVKSIGRQKYQSEFRYQSHNRY